MGNFSGRSTHTIIRMYVQILLVLLLTCNVWTNPIQEGGQVDQQQTQSNKDSITSGIQSALNTVTDFYNENKDTVAMLVTDNWDTIKDTVFSVGGTVGNTVSDTLQDFFTSDETTKE